MIMRQKKHGITVALQIVLILMLSLLLFGILTFEIARTESVLRREAAASAALAIIMYTLGASWAALFEVSVCAGLITVIFISGISLSHDTKAEVRREYDDKRRMGVLPVVLVAAGIVMIGAGAAIHFEMPVAQRLVQDFREVFWNSRQADIWGQIIVMLTGGTAISVLIKEEKKKS